MHLLMAEDDPNIAVIAKLSLEQIGGFKLTLVNDGEQALTAALKNDFDVLLLDEMMPKRNGLSVAKEYKALCPDPKPIIFLSAKSQESDLQLFKQFGLGHIAKPFDPMTLAQQIKDLLKSYQANVA